MPLDYIEDLTDEELQPFVTEMEEDPYYQPEAYYNLPTAPEEFAAEVPAENPYDPFIAGWPGMSGAGLAVGALGAAGIDARPRQPVNPRGRPPAPTSLDQQLDLRGTGIVTDNYGRPIRNSMPISNPNQNDPGEGYLPVRTLMGTQFGRQFVKNPEYQPPPQQQQKPWEQWSTEEKLTDWANRGDKGAKQALADIWKQRVLDEDKGISKDGLASLQYAPADLQKMAELDYTEQLIDSRFADGKEDPGQYASAKAQIARQRSAIRPRMQPRERSPFPPGQGEGEVWTNDRTGSVYTRKGGEVKLVEKAADRTARPPTFKEFNEHISQVIQDSTAGKGENAKPISEDEATKIVRKRFDEYKKYLSGGDEAQGDMGAGPPPKPSKQDTSKLQGEDLLRARYQEAKASGQADKVAAAQAVAAKFGIDLETPSPKGAEPAGEATRPGQPTAKTPVENISRADAIRRQGAAPAIEGFPAEAAAPPVRANITRAPADLKFGGAQFTGQPDQLSAIAKATSTFSKTRNDEVNQAAAQLARLRRQYKKGDEKKYDAITKANIIRWTAIVEQYLRQQNGR